MEVWKVNGKHEPDDAKELWLTQETDGVTIPVEEMRRRVERSSAMARRTRLTAAAAAGINLLAVASQLLVPSPHPLRPWLFAVQVLSLVVWFLYFTPSQAAEWNRLLTLDLASNRSPCLNFYRRELGIRRDRYRENFRIILLIGILLVPFLLRRYLVQAAILFGLSLAFFLVAYVRMKRELPQIRVEIADLDAFERQS